MTVQQRVDDIAKRSNLSPEIVRSVLNAETESIVESLEQGQRATLIGRVTLRPEIRTRLRVGGTVQKQIKVQLSLASQIEEHLDAMDGFKKDIPDTQTTALKQAMEARGKEFLGGKPANIRKDSVLDEVVSLHDSAYT